MVDCWYLIFIILIVMCIGWMQCTHYGCENLSGYDCSAAYSKRSKSGYSGGMLIIE